MPMNSLDPLPASRWNEGTARHLLNRAGFGIPRERVNHLAGIGRQAAVDTMVDFDRYPDTFPEPRNMPEGDYYYAHRKRQAGLDEDARRKERNAFYRREAGHVQTLRDWWLDRMVDSPRPLEEKMTLFWHGHFATSVRKVRLSRPTYELNGIFRAHAVGDFKALTVAVGQSPAMLQYLDNNRNIKGKPNENWARELMELFTLGVGNYSEDDIKESARAFTGWNFNHRGFDYREGTHDFDKKTFLGRKGKFDGWDILDIIFDDPAAAEFIVRKLWVFFVYDEPEAGIVSELATTLRREGYRIAPVLKRIFNAQAFYSERAVGSQIKSPVQLVVQLAHDLELDPVPYRDMARASAELGQNLFAPPNVKGWDGGRAWINANALLTRYNLPKTLLTASIMAPEADPSMMMATKDAPEPMELRLSTRVRSVMKQLPKEERKELRGRLNDATSAYDKRTAIDRFLLERPIAGLWNPRSLVDELDFETVGECVDQLMDRHHADKSGEARPVLVLALGRGAGADAPLSRDTIGPKALDETLHLLLSAAEYQLC